MSRPLSPGGGFAQGLSDVLGPIATERRRQREAGRERQAELLEHNMESIGANIAQAQSEMNALDINDPRRADIQQQIEGYNQQHQAAAQAYHALYGPEDLPGLLGRMKHWFERKQVRGQNARPTPQQQTPQAPGAQQPPVDMNSPTMQQPADAIPARLPAANEPIGGQQPVTLPGQQPAAPMPTAPAAAPAAPAQPRAQAAPSAPMSERIPGTSATPPSALSAEQLRRNPALAQTPEMSVAAAKRPAAATWTPVGEPYMSTDGTQLLQRERDPKSGAYRETVIPGKSPETLENEKLDRTFKQLESLHIIPPEKLAQVKAVIIAGRAGPAAAALFKTSGTSHPLEPKFNPSTGGLYSIVDKDTDSEWNESNIATAPKEVQDEWAALKKQTADELKRKSDEEDKKETGRREAQQRLFDQQNSLLDKRIANAFDQKDYATAEKLRTDAMTKYNDTLRLSNFADETLANHNAAKDKMLAGQLIRLSEGRFNIQQYDNLVKNAGLANTFEQWMNNISTGELTDNIRRQLVNVAHDLRDSAKKVVDANKQPQRPATAGELKNKAKPQAAPAADPLGILK